MGAWGTLSRVDRFAGFVPQRRSMFFIRGRSRGESSLAKRKYEAASSRGSNSVTHGYAAWRTDRFLLGDSTDECGQAGKCVTLDDWCLMLGGLAAASFFLRHSSGVR